MNFCFIMYPWENIDAETDSTIRLIHEVALRGHTLAVTCPNNLTVRNNVTSSFCKRLLPFEKVPASLVTFHRKARFKEQLLPLSGFDVIFLRSNPPVDSMMLNFLDSVKNDTFIINSIEGLRLANNKIYTTSFFDKNSNFIPETHVSKNKEYLKRIINNSEKSRMILKPLNGFGGKGVIVIEKNAVLNINSLLDYYITGRGEDNYVILQEYIDGADKGDVRILMLNGEPIGAMKRIPAEDDIRSNIHAGGREVKHVLTKQEKLLCKKIKPKLIADGLLFVGIDVINGKLLEINVCSPGGITRINRLNRVKLQQRIIDFVENEINIQEEALLRKKEFRRKISNI